VFFDNGFDFRVLLQQLGHRIRDQPGNLHAGRHFKVVEHLGGLPVKADMHHAVMLLNVIAAQ